MDLGRRFDCVPHEPPPCRWQDSTKQRRQNYLRVIGYRKFIDNVCQTCIKRLLLRSTLTLWQCAAKVISTFLIFAVSVLRVNNCRPYAHFFELSSFFSIYISCTVVMQKSVVAMTACRKQWLSDVWYLWRQQIFAETVALFCSVDVEYFCFRYCCQ